jgi:acetyl-CoA carboxylase carboxyltransferase component
MQGDHRAEMLLRLARVLDAQAARGGHAARERIDLLLDRDSPFLELAPLADGDAVVGIGVVEATACLVVSGDRRPADPDDPKVARATTRASACGLPVVVLDDLSGSAEALHRHRAQVRWGAAGTATRRRPPVPGTVLPQPDPEALLDVPPPREILRHVVDGAAVDEVHAGADGVTGWATVGGLPVGVVARDAAAPAAPPPEMAGVPILRLTVTAVPGSAPEIAVRVSTAGAAFRFSWPGAELPPATAADHDGVIDPRDTRIVVGIARWCLEPC